MKRIFLPLSGFLMDASSNIGIILIEQFCKSKSGVEQDCEDLLFISDHYIAVIDGATSKSSALFEGKTGGRIAAECIAQSLANPLWDPRADARTVADAIQASLKAYSNEKCLESVHLCASAVIFSVKKRQVWAVGDCQFIVNGKLYTFGKKVDAILSETRSLAIQMLLASGISEEDLLKHDKAREMILPLLKMQEQLENNPSEYGYSVFSDHGEVSNVSITDIPEGAELVLASDGYPELKPTLEESEKALGFLLKEDPLCYKTYKSTKGICGNQESFDDRTFIRYICP